MKVTAQATEGTIGGGALEYQAIEKARRMLANRQDDLTLTWPLGPNLGQCCGGAVTLHFGRQARVVDAIEPNVHTPAFDTQEPIHLWIWGAGHVGRAVALAAPPKAFCLTWVDTDIARFPPHPERLATVVPAAEMPVLASKAPAQTHHLIFTYCHDIDLALCDALLRRPVASVGLIGSATKWRRFQTRLGALGHTADAIAGITCPIGDPSLGKRPSDIASGVIAAYLKNAGSDAGAARGRIQA